MEERKNAEGAIADTAIEYDRIAGLNSDVSKAWLSSRALPETLQICCESIVEHLGAAFARVWTLNADTNVLELAASAGCYTHLDGGHSRIPVGKLKIGLIAQEQKPILTNEVIGDPRFNDQEWAKREGMVAFAGYPLVIEDRLLGVMAMFARQPLTHTILQALGTIADAIAIGVERQRAETMLKDQTEVLEAIYRIGQTLAAELDLQKLVQAVTDAATELTGAQFGSFFYNVYDGGGASYMLYSLSGAPREAFSSFPMPRATGLFGPTFRGEKTIRLDDVTKDPRYGKNAPHHGMPAGHLPVVSYLAVPVISRTSEVIGGLFFGHSKPGVFNRRHERIVEGLAAHAAIAMDNARLYQRAQDAIKEREALLEREQEARQEAEIANRAKDEFLGILSHELRTPLQAILGWTRILSSGKLSGEAAARAIESVDQAAKLQARLIEDLLDVSRIISGKLRLDAQPVDVATVIQAAVENLRPAMEAKDIRVQLGLDFGAGVVHGDAVRLQQVVWNLLSNAIKFTPKGGRVQVQLKRVNSHVEVSVIDTGPGIEAEFLPHLFERFRQANSSSTRKSGGLGLGLAIVRHLVELHGGTVEANNRADHPGAMFTVKLPVMAVRPPTEVAGESPQRVHPAVSGHVRFESAPSLAGLKILAVDDDEDGRRLLTVVLEECGAKIRTCNSSADGLKALVEFKPDILISDIGMPDEDGYAFIKQVRALDSFQGGQVPAVALTAYARVEDRLKALSAGYNMHIAKPVEPLELVVVVASLAKRSISKLTL